MQTSRGSPLVMAARAMKLVSAVPVRRAQLTSGCIYYSLPSFKIVSSSRLIKRVIFRPHLSRMRMPYAKCMKLLTQASAQIQNVNMYDVFGDCVSDSGCPANHEATLKPKSKVPILNTYAATHSGLGAEQGYMSPRLTPDGPVACINSRTASNYLNQPDVMKAIHVEPPTSNCWSVCGTAPGWTYNSTRANLPAILTLS